MKYYIIPRPNRATQMQIFANLEFNSLAPDEREALKKQLSQISLVSEESSAYYQEYERVMGINYETEAEVLQAALLPLELTVVCGYKKGCETPYIHIFRSQNKKLSLNDETRVRSILEKHGYIDAYFAIKTAKVSDRKAQTTEKESEVAATSTAQDHCLPLEHYTIHMLLQAAQSVSSSYDPESKPVRFAQAAESFVEWFSFRCKFDYEEQNNRELFVNHRKAFILALSEDNLIDYIQTYEEACEFAEYLSMNKLLHFHAQTSSFNNNPALSQAEFDEAKLLHAQKKLTFK